MSKKISQLTAAASLTGTELVPVVQSGATLSATAAQIAGQLAASGVSAGSYTNASITVNARGQVTAAANGSAAPGGSAGGDLAGSYPNPTLLTGVFNVKNATYGAFGNGKILTDVTTTSGSAVISSASYSFVSGDVGKYVTIIGAGASGAVLNATLSSVASGAATLSIAAGTSVAGTANVTFGTDDTAAIQAAVSAASAAGGGVVVLPTGIFVVTGPITWASKVSMKGNGAGKSILKFIRTTDMTNGVIVGTSGSATNPYIDCQFSDFEIDCIAATMASPSYIGKGFYIQYMIRPVFTRLYIHDTPASGLGTDFLKEACITDNILDNCGRLQPATGGAAIGIGVGSASATFTESMSVVGNKVTNAFRYGIFFETQTGALTTTVYAECVGNTVIAGAITQYGIGDCGLTGFVCVGNTVVGNSTSLDGIRVSQGTTAGSPGVKGIIANNNLINIGANGISLDYTSNPGVISGYQIKNNTINGAGGGIAIIPGTGGVNTLTISGNEISGANGAGVILASGSGGISDLIMENNKIFNNALTTGTSTRQCGISVNCALTRPRINGNSCFDNATGRQLYAMIVNAVALTNARLIANDFSNNATGAINLVSGGSIAGQVISNKGYNPVGTSSVTPGASPWTYTAGNTPEVLYVLGGTVSNVTKNGISLATSLSASQALPVALQPGDAVIVTYTAVPTATRDQL